MNGLNDIFVIDTDLGDKWTTTLLVRANNKSEEKSPPITSHLARLPAIINGDDPDVKFMLISFAVVVSKHMKILSRRVSKSIAWRYQWTSERRKMSSSSGRGKFRKIKSSTSRLISKENKQTDHRGLVEIEIISAIWATDDPILFSKRQKMKKNLKLVLEIRDPRVVRLFIHEFYDNFSVWFCF